MSENHRRAEFHEAQITVTEIAQSHIQAMNCKRLASARQRLGLRQPSTVLALLASAQSARGLAHSKTSRRFERFLMSGDACFIN